MKKLIVIMLVVFILASPLVGCSTKTTNQAVSTAPAVPAKDTIIAVDLVAAESLDPAQGKYPDDMLYSAIFDKLVRFGPNGEILPDLAESWTKSDDGLSYTFKLRQGVKFHDGSPFTADDVIFSYDTLFTTAFYKAVYFNVTAWEKVDDYTVKISFYAPYTMALESLCFGLYILPKTLYTADPAAFGLHPVGTGPYKFVSQATDGSITLIANDDYFGGKPEIPNAIIRPPLDPSTAVVALQNGEVDLIENVLAAQIPLLQDDSNVNLVQTQATATWYLYMWGSYLNADQNLRKAIFYGVDRDKLIQIANEGIGVKSVDLINSKALGPLAGSVPVPDYNKTLAAEFLAQSNYSPDKVLTLTTTAASAAAAQSIQSDLSALGINVNIEQLDDNSFLTKQAAGELELSLSYLIEFGLAPAEILYWYTPESGAYGLWMYSSPEYEALITQMLAEIDDTARNELVKQGLQMQIDLANELPLFESVMNFAYSKSITNIQTFNSVNNLYYLGDIKLAQ